MQVVFRALLLSALLGTTLAASAQFPLSYQKPLSWSEELGFNAERVASVATKALPAVDADALKVEDVFREEANLPFRYGVPVPVTVSPRTDGEWFDLGDGRKLWLGKITAVGARSVGVHLRKYRLPKGASLTFYNEDRTEWYGAYTSAHNQPHGLMGSMPLSGQTMYIEYVTSQDDLNDTPFEVFEIIQGYKDVFQAVQARDFGDAEACHVNINCPEGARWDDQKRGVALIVLGSGGVCTGSMINNTAQDGRPLFLTAYHCYDGSGATTPFDYYVFNWESEGCTNPGSAPLQKDILSGSTRLATHQNSDFFLVEMNQPVPEAYNLFFNGWDRTTSAADSAIGIHHPAGDIKKFAKDNNSPVVAGIDVVTQNTNSDVNMWRVQWNNGVTAGGSSGSPLFDGTHKRIIGQLWGGGSFCSTPTSPDYYGRFNLSWDRSGSSSANRLRDYLDPGNTGATTLDGAYFGDDIPGAEYCVSSSTNSEPDGAINGITFKTINTTSPTGTCAGYTDRTGNSVTLAPSENATLTIKIHNCNGTAASYSKVVKAWIDWNADGDFEDAGEQVFSSGLLTGGGYPNQVAPITVPADIPAATVRLRVTLRETAQGETDPQASNNTLPCGIYTWGETEDYTVVLDGVASNDRPTAQTVATSVYPNPASGQFTLTWQSEDRSEPVSATVEDLGGRCLLTTTLTYNTLTARYEASVSTGGLAPGLYLVHLVQGSQVAQEKVVVR